MKRIALIILIIGTTILIQSCKNKDAELTITINSVGECINTTAKITEKDASFSYHSATSILNINKYNNYYPCQGEINISAEIKDKTIKITEQVSQQTDCKCPKDISYTIGKTPSGEYKISINEKIIGEVLVY